MTSAPRHRPAQVEPWPKWARFPLIAALVAVVVYGVVASVHSGINTDALRVVIAAVLISRTTGTWFSPGGYGAAKPSWHPLSSVPTRTLVKGLDVEADLPAAQRRPAPPTSRCGTSPPGVSKPCVCCSKAPGVRPPRCSSPCPPRRRRGPGPRRCVVRWPSSRSWRGDWRSAPPSRSGAPAVIHVLCVQVRTPPLRTPAPARPRNRQYEARSLPATRSLQSPCAHLSVLAGTALLLGSPAHGSSRSRPR